MTPAWVTVLASALTGVFTLAGVLVTQRSTTRRDRATAEREERARTFDARERAYIEFLAADEQLLASVGDDSDPEGVEELAATLLHRLPALQMYAPPAVLGPAYLVIANAAALVVPIGDVDRKELREASGGLRFDLRQAIREDLGVTALTGSIATLDNEVLRLRRLTLPSRSEQVPS